MNPLLFGPIFDIIKQVLGGLGLDPAIKEKAQAQALEVLTSGTFDQKSAQALAIAQIGVNQTEASTPGLFKGGWRPFTGWTCGAALAYVAILEPIARFIATVSGYSGAFPVIDTTITMQVLFGMLGLGGMRSFEKSKGAA